MNLLFLYKSPFFPSKFIKFQLFFSSSQVQALWHVLPQNYLQLRHSIPFPAFGFWRPWLVSLILLNLFEWFWNTFIFSDWLYALQVMTKLNSMSSRERCFYRFFDFRDIVKIWLLRWTQTLFQGPLGIVCL